MLANPSILVSLFLIIKFAASSDNLADHFVPTDRDIADVDRVLEEHQHLWPEGVLSFKTLRGSLEAGEHDLVKSILEELAIYDLDDVLNVVLYPSCTNAMLDNLRQMRFGQDVGKQCTVREHVFIHQPWEITKNELAGIDDSENGVLFLMAVGMLVFKALRCKRFVSMMKVFSACSQEHVRQLIDRVLNAILCGRRPLVPIAKLVLLNDPDDNIGAKLFELLSGERDPISQDFVELFESPTVNSQQFARIINATLSDKDIDTRFIPHLVEMADPSDILALKEHITSEDLQKKFLQYFDVEAPTNLDSAWSSVKLKRHDRLEGWYRRNATRILKLLQSMDLLPATFYTLVLEYLV